MRWKDCRLVAFDTETTGLNPFDGDRVIEFGAVELQLGSDGRVRDTRAVQMFINPTIPIPRASTRIHHITDDDVADAPTFDGVASKIRDTLEGAVLIAQNLAFDLNFIRMELRTVGLEWPPTVAEVDTLPLAQRLMPDLRNHKLGTICAALGIPLDNAHRASHDAEATGRVLVELCDRNGAPPELDAFIGWADAVSPPPDTGHLTLGMEGVAIFTGGPHAGDTVEMHPDYLQWMSLALERRAGRWHPRFPESVREWARRWLRARCAGRSRSSPRSAGPSDWNIDPSPWP